jgi:hypothetical protein
MTEVHKKIKPKLRSEDTYMLISQDKILVMEKKQNKVKPIGTLTVDKLIDSLSNQISLNTNLLPKDCIYYKRLKQDGSIQHLYVFEASPKKQRISYQLLDPNNGDKIYNKTYLLSFPYIQSYVLCTDFGHAINITKTSITCTKSPILNINDQVFALPINNLHTSDGNICWGYINLKGHQKDESIGDYCRRSFTSFFGSVFNNHLRPFVPKEIYPKVDAEYLRRYPQLFLDQWENLSKTNDDAGLSFSYLQYNDKRVFKDFINVEDR